MNSTNLKKSNRWLIVLYLIGQAIILLSLSNKISINLMSWDNIGMLVDPKSILVYLIFILAIILEGIMSSNLKATLVFLRVRNPLPGTRAFSYIARDDPRINTGSLKKMYDNKLPKSPKQQNDAWYKLYKKYSLNPVVAESHKSFLLTRDLASITLILIPVVLMSHIILSTNWSLIWLNIVLLFIFLISLIAAANNYGNRFVANVLVEATINSQGGESFNKNAKPIKEA